MIQIFLSVFLFYSGANAVEFLCWKNGNMPSMAFEAFVRKCDNTQDFKIAEQAGERDVVCVTAAQCIALTSNVVALVKSNTSAKTVADIKKLSANEIGMSLSGSKFSGRMSQITCKGKGQFRVDQFNNISLQETNCPEVADCAGAEDVQFNLGMAMSTTADLKNTKSGSTIVVTPNGSQK